MLDIASTLSYAKFDDIKGLDSAKKMRDTLAMEETVMFLEPKLKVSEVSLMI